MAVRFDAATDRLLRTTDLPDCNAAYTWMAWIYLVSDLNAVSNLFVFSDNSNGITEAAQTANDGVTLQINVRGPSGTGTANGTTLNVGQWYHVAMVRETTTSVKIYLDGTLDITNTVDVSTRGAATRMEHGAKFSGNQQRSDSRQFAIKFWSTNLSLAEIQNEMRTIRPHRTANLYGFWPCFPGATERLRDYSGNSRDWTEGGTLTDEDPPPLGWGAQAYVLPFAEAAGGTVNLTATIAGVTSTPSATLTVARAMSATSAWASSTPSATLTVARLLTATSDWQTATGDATLTTVLQLAAAIGIQTATPNATLNVARAMSATSAWQTLTSDASISTGLLLSATIGIQTATNDATLNIARALAISSDWQSATPAATINVARALAASGDWQTTTPAALLAVARSLSATSAWQAVTGDATLVSLVSLAASVDWQTATPNATITVSRALQATSAWQTTTGSGGLTLAILIAALIEIQTATGDATLETEAAVIRGNGLAFILFRDKRAVVGFRDKRAAVVFRDKRASEQE